MEPAPGKPGRLSPRLSDMTGQALKLAMTRLGLGTNQLGKEIGYNATTISQYRSGVMPIPTHVENNIQLRLEIWSLNNQDWIKRNRELAQANKEFDEYART